MNYIPLEITVQSAQVFKKNTNNGYHTHHHLYAIASIHDRCSGRKSPQTATVDIFSDGCHPSSPIRFRIEESKLLELENSKNPMQIILQVKCKRTLVADKNIGLVYVPVNELFQFYCCNNSYPSLLSDRTTNLDPKYVAFTICSPGSGKPRGVLYLSCVFHFGNQYRDDKQELMSKLMKKNDININININITAGSTRLKSPIPSAPYIGGDYDDDEVEFGDEDGRDDLTHVEHGHNNKCYSEVDDGFGRHNSSKMPIPSAPYLPEEYCV